MNVYLYVLTATVAILLVGVALSWIDSKLEERREERRYYRIKDDAAFWQMKIEQSLMNSGDEFVEKVEKMVKELDEWDNEQTGFSKEEFDNLNDDFEQMKDDIVI